MAEESKLKAAPLAGGTKKAGLFNRFDNPWLNWKFLGGAGILTIIGILILIGYIFWDTSLALSASSPLNLPPVGFTNWRGQEGVPEHPLGTENSGRDMLALIIVGTPRTIGVGVIAAYIMFREIMPNLLPYLAASYIGNMAGAIINAIGLEVLGFGPQRIPSLGVAIFFSIEAAALLRDMWWWWGLPTLILAILFIALLLINLGLDEIANPRLRKA